MRASCSSRPAQRSALCSLKLALHTADQSGLNEYNMPAIADSLTQYGLQAAGYRFVNSDAGWQPPLGKRTPYLGRNSTGSPTGYLDMAELGATLHSKGFLYGLYSALSSVQCGIAPGGLFHEELDAESYAAWGLDYIKYICTICSTAVS